MSQITGRELRHRLMHYRGKKWDQSMIDWQRQQQEAAISETDLAELNQFLDLLDAQHGVPGTLVSIRTWVTEQLRDICQRWASARTNSSDLLANNRNLINELIFRQKQHPVFQEADPLRFLIEASETLVNFLGNKEETQQFSSSRHTQHLPPSGDTTIAYALRTQKISPKVKKCPDLKTKLPRKTYNVFLLAEFCARSHQDISHLLGIDAAKVAVNVSAYEVMLAA